MKCLSKTTQSQRVVKLAATALTAVLIVVFATRMDVSAQAECPVDAPTPVEVTVTSVPIVVTSTTNDYFVLYVSHDVDGSDVEIPVLVKRGSAGTTTLAENVEALPAERYRVEKYLIADPADVDGDCIDDITELGDLGNMSPVNPAAAIELSDGAVVVLDTQTYDALAVGGYFKFGLIGIDTDRPSVYFINTKTHPTHQTFLDDRSINRQRVILGAIAYNQNLVAPDGSQGVYRYSLNTLPLRYRHSFSLMERIHTLLAASMPLLEDNLALYVRNSQLPDIQSDLPLYRESRINLVFDGDVYSGINFLALNPGVGYGRLQVLDPDGRPHPRNIVIYEALPNELPRVAGIMTTVPQTPLSHVNLRAVQDGIPNAYIRYIRDDPAVAPLIGSYVRYEVAEDGYSVRAATKEEVDAHYEASRPQPQTPEQDLSVTEITPLNEIGFEDWRAFGVKAANVAVLGTLDFPEGTVPEGFAIPFHFYDEFMKANGFYGAITDMLADEDFQTDFDVQDDMLDDLRDDIKDADTPQWIIDALTAMHAEFPAGQSLRYRSSTNNEDLPGFNGAGLYDSKTQDPEETAADGIDKSLKGVFASLWTFRAFTEREFHRIDHLAAMMGVLVHPNYKDELANGAAVSFDPIHGWEETYYVNSQLGEDLVTNPVAHSVPEELLLFPGGGHRVLFTSNLVPRGQLLMSAARLVQLAQHLTTIHDHFEDLYNPGSGEPFAMEIEFKITSDNILAIKQARPWVFYSADDAIREANEAPVISSGSRTEFTYRENETSTIYTFSATDPEAGEITWSLSGTDYYYFAIDESGRLSFLSPPDYESPADSGGDNVYEVTVVARDAASNSDTLEIAVTVTDVNEGPEISRVGSAPASVPENQDPSLVLARYTATDPEGGTVSRWRTSGSDGGDFAINEQGELRFRYTPDYERPVDSNRDNTYVFTVQVSDGSYYGTFEETVTVTPVNEPPTITTTTSSATVLRQNENVTSRLYTYRATDPEGSDVTWSVGGTDGRFFTIDERGQFSFSESSPPDFEQPGDSGRDNVYDVTIQARDDGFNTVSLPVTVTVREVNEGPEISRVGSAPNSVPENQDQMQVLARYTATDPEGGTVSRWRTSGTDGGDFVMNEQGELRFRNSPDYERPVDSNQDNAYVFTVQVSDGRYYGTFEETVTVTPVDEPPTITTSSSSATALRQNENQTSRLYTYRATDPEGSDVAWSVGGTDGRFFTIDESGQFSFKEETPPDFEQPGDLGRDNVYDVTVQARDDGGNTASLPVTVTVREVNEGPEVTGGRSSFTINENQDLPNAIYAATDPEGGSVTRWTLGGSDGGDFTISEAGVLTFRHLPDYERPADSTKDNIYELQVRPYDGRYYGSFDVTVTVNDVNEPPTITTTSASATTLLQKENLTNHLYTYRATDPEGSTVTWSVGGTDGRFFTIEERGQFSFREEDPPDFEQPGDSGRDNVYEVTIQARDDGSNTRALSVTVTVTNDAEGVEPTISTRRPPTTYRENGTSAVYTFRASDPQRQSITWSLEGEDRGDFTLTEDSSGRGTLAFSSPPDYENPADADRQNDYELTVIATDEDGHRDWLSFTVTVTEVNEGPEVSGPSSFTIAENGRLSNAGYTATDPEGGHIARWSVGGRDGGDFFITQGGTLYFRSLPDYDRPADSDRDNVYEITIQPSDGRVLGSYPVTVTVTDVNEAPEIRSGSTTSFTQQENRTSRLYTYSATDPEEGAVTWSVGGTDGNRLFTIDEQRAVLLQGGEPAGLRHPGWTWARTMSTT